MAREKNKLTKKDYELLEYIKENIMKKGFPPTVREMCKFSGLSSTSSVFSHLNKLEAKYRTPASEAEIPAPAETGRSVDDILERLDTISKFM